MPTVTLSTAAEPVKVPEAEFNVLAVLSSIKEGHGPAISRASKGSISTDAIYTLLSRLEERGLVKKRTKQIPIGDIGSKRVVYSLHQDLIWQSATEADRAQGTMMNDTASTSTKTPEQTYIEAEVQLATLLGWTQIVHLDGTLLGRPPEGRRACRGQAMVPRWCRDWSHAGPLINEYDIDLQHDGKDTVFTNWEGSVQGYAHDVIEHPNKDAATRYAIVIAVITKLEAELKPKVEAGRRHSPAMG